MKKLSILILAVATAAIAYLEYCTIGIPRIGEVGFDVMSLYLPAAIVIISTAVFIFLRFPLKDIAWSIVSGTVAVISSFIWSPLTVLAGQWLESHPVSDINLLLIILLMVAYLLAIPAIALGIYFNSMKDAIKKIVY